MAERVQDIWSFPKDGQPPDLAWVLAAPDLDTFATASLSLQAAAEEAMEAQTAQTLAESRALAAALREKGVDFDIDRIMKPSLADRVSDLVEDAKDWLHDLTGSQSGPAPADVPFLHAVPVGCTYPTDQIALDYDDLFALTQAFRADLADQISVGWGAARAPDIPQTVLEDLYDSEDWDDDDQLLFVLADLTHYWPAGARGFALGLMERQEDGGLPIEIALVAHGPQADQQITALLQAKGGGWR